MKIGPIWLMQPIPYFGEELVGEWIYEEKIDGWRMQVIKYKNQIEFWGRRLEKNPNWTEKLTYLKEIAMKFLPQYTLIDCELYSEKGRKGIPSLFTKHRKIKPIIYVFDIVFLEKEFVGSKALKERKEILKDLKFIEPFHFLNYNFFKSFSDVKVSKDAEGIILKNWSSIYLVGNEAPVATIDWRKLKYGYK
ncbi:MAG: RNA ligase family protein [Candidatus Ratteibacteria bacterium]